MDKVRVVNDSGYANSTKVYVGEAELNGILSLDLCFRVDEPVIATATFYVDSVDITSLLMDKETDVAKEW